MARKTTNTRARKRDNVITSENDNLSDALSDLVPEEYRGTSRFLDVIQWNIEWFGAAKSASKDKRRYDVVLDILEALNGDLFVFQEVAGPSKDGRYPGLLDSIAADLTAKGAGDYVVYYTEAGGEQRVAMMWDRDWLRAKSDVTDLFPKGTHKTPDGKDAFATRTPLHGYFSARLPAGAAVDGPPGGDKFDFQVLGVHLKAMAEGAPQRLASAKVLAKWLKEEAPTTDADAMIMGDWNAAPDDECWAPLHALEDENTVAFRRINDPSDFSYLWLANRKDKYVSKIDLTAMTLSSEQQVVGDPAQVIRWKPIQDAIAEAGDLTAVEVRNVLKEIKDTISDHLPTVSRFYILK